MADVDLSEFGTVDKTATPEKPSVDLSSFGEVEAPKGGTDTRGFLQSAVDKLNPIPAIRDWFNAPTAGDALHAAHLMGESKHRQLNDEESKFMDRMKTAKFQDNGPESDIFRDSIAPTIEAGGQAAGGNYSGAAGTMVGAYGVPLAAGAAMEGAPRVAGATVEVARKLGKVAENPIAHELLGAVSPRAAHIANLASRGVSVADKISDILKQRGVEPAVHAPPTPQGEFRIPGSLDPEAATHAALPPGAPAPPMAGSVPVPQGSAVPGSSAADLLTHRDPTVSPTLPSSPGRTVQSIRRPADVRTGALKTPAQLKAAQAFADAMGDSADTTLAPRVENKGFEMLRRPVKARALADLLHEHEITPEMAAKITPEQQARIVKALPQVEGETVHAPSEETWNRVIEELGKKQRAKALALKFKQAVQPDAVAQ